MAAFGDAAWVALFGCITLLGLITLVGVTMLRRPTRDITAKLGTMSIQLGAVHHAINGRPDGSPTISEQVAAMAERVDQIDTKVDGLAGELGSHILANPGLPEEPRKLRGPGRPRYGM